MQRLRLISLRFTYFSCIMYPERETYIKISFDFPLHILIHSCSSTIVFRCHLRPSIVSCLVIQFTWSRISLHNLYEYSYFFTLTFKTKQTY